MLVDKFLDSSKITQAICLIIPILGWITEIMIRFSAMLRRPNFDNIFMFIASIPMGIIIALIDIVFVVILNGDPIFMKV